MAVNKPATMHCLHTLPTGLINGSCLKLLHSQNRKMTHKSKHKSSLHNHQDHVSSSWRSTSPSDEQHQLILKLNPVVKELRETSAASPSVELNIPRVAHTCTKEKKTHSHFQHLTGFTTRPVHTHTRRRAHWIKVYGPRFTLHSLTVTTNRHSLL